MWQCPRCADESSRVIKTIPKFPVLDGTGKTSSMEIIRTRICECCHFTWTTKETIENVFIYNSKKMQKQQLSLWEYENGNR